MKRNAFTLIEVMVVLSILAIIAILAYNIFGNTMKEARSTELAIEIVRHMQTFSNAIESYQLDNNGDWPWDGSAVVDSAINSSAISPYLKASIAPPIEAKHALHGTYRYEISLGNWNNPNSPSAENDYYMALRGVSDEVCKAINKTYAPTIGYDIYDSAGGTDFPIPEEKIYCFTSAANLNWASLILEMR